MIRSVILVLFAGLVCLLALRSLRAQRLKERYVLMFIAVSGPFLVLALWPDGIVWFSDLLKIEKATVLVLVLAAFMILIIFELLSIVSVQERKIAALAQVVGLLTEKQALNGRPAQPPMMGGTPGGEHQPQTINPADRHGA